MPTNVDLFFIYIPPVLWLIAVVAHCFIVLVRHLCISITQFIFSKIIRLELLAFAFSLSPSLDKLHSIPFSMSINSSHLIASVLAASLTTANALWMPDNVKRAQESTNPESKNKKKFEKQTIHETSVSNR